MDLKKLDAFAKDIIFEAGRRIRESFTYDLEVETKSSANVGKEPEATKETSFFDNEA